MSRMEAPGFVERSVCSFGLRSKVRREFACLETLGRFSRASTDFLESSARTASKANCVAASCPSPPTCERQSHQEMGGSLTDREMLTEQPFERLSYFFLNVPGSA